MGDADLQPEQEAKDRLTVVRCARSGSDVGKYSTGHRGWVEEGKRGRGKTIPGWSDDPRVRVRVIENTRAGEEAVDTPAGVRRTPEASECLVEGSGCTGSLRGEEGRELQPEVGKGGRGVEHARPPERRHQAGGGGDEVRVILKRDGLVARSAEPATLPAPGRLRVVEKKGLDESPGGGLLAFRAGAGRA